jgi:flagellar basal-body rod protein FlgF
VVNGLYTASRGMSNILAKQDINAQNLANSNTTGFKLSRVVNRSEVSVGRNDENQLVQSEKQEVSDVYTSFEQGPMVRTGNSMDLALSSSGFFMVEGDEGTGYTRGGSLAMNSYGEIVNVNGRRMLDENGAPILVHGDNVQFLDDGSIFVDGNKAGKLGVVDFPDTHKLKYGADGMFVNTDPDHNAPKPAELVGVKQGFLEGSNVDTISTMVTMLAEFRNYEADQKALKAVDDTLGKAVNEVGRV